MESLGPIRTTVSVAHQLSRSRIEKRLQKLEAAMTDVSRLSAAHPIVARILGPAVLPIHDRPGFDAIGKCPVDAIRAVMQYVDSPASLVGSIPSEDSNQI